MIKLYNHSVLNRALARRVPKTILQLCLLLGATLTSFNVQADPYANATGYKAAAIHTGSPDELYIVAEQPNKLAAAAAAQTACAQAQSTNHTAGHCELVRLGDKALIRAAQIKARLGQDPHPLYLWRYQSEQSVVYLAGSVHILKPGLYPLAPQYQAAFDATDNLVVEVDLGAFSPQQLQTKSMQYALLPEAQTLSQVMPDTTYKALSAITAEYGLPIAQMDRFKPAFITQQLAVLALMSVGYDPGQGVEAFFTSQAKNKQILQLETLDFQLNLLMNQPLATQLAMVDDTITQMDQFEVQTADLVGAWLAGNDAEFEAAFSAQSGSSPESQAFMRELMDERNAGMAAKISGFLKTPGSYFVLIGAGHYVGENSVIDRLQRQGIHGQRIHSNQSISQ